MIIDRLESNNSRRTSETLWLRKDFQKALNEDGNGERMGRQGSLPGHVDQSILISLPQFKLLGKTIW